MKKKSNSYFLAFGLQDKAKGILFFLPIRGEDNTMPYMIILQGKKADTSRKIQDWL
jgi:hypothetical protein